MFKWFKDKIAFRDRFTNFSTLEGPILICTSIVGALHPNYAYNCILFYVFTVGLYKTFYNPIAKRIKIQEKINERLNKNLD